MCTICTFCLCLYELSAGSLAFFSSPKHASEVNWNYDNAYFAGVELDKSTASTAALNCKQENV